MCDIKNSPILKRALGPIHILANLFGRFFDARIGRAAKQSSVIVSMAPLGSQEAEKKCRRVPGTTRPPSAQ
jgi:hypothetical protein